MTEKDSLFSRLGRWMESFRRDDRLPQLAVGNRLPQPVPPEPEIDQLEPADDKSSNRLMPWRKRDQILEQLQTGYDKVLDLVGSIQDHLTLHNQRSDQVAELLMVLSKGIEDVPKATRQHADALGGLARQMETDNRQNRSMIEAVSELPRAAHAQRQGMETIATQVQASAAVTQKLSDRLDSVGQVVKMLGDALSEQVRTLKVVQQATRHQESQMVAALDQQSRRSTLLITSTLVLAAVLALATGISLFT